MNFNEYQELSKRTMPNPDKKGMYLKPAIANYGLGLAGESGEVVDLLKKHLFHGHVISEVDLKKELGDVLHYLSGVAEMFDIRLEDVAIANIEKLKKRYPEGFSTEASINRSE